jgi:hypothetical protein
LSFTHPINGQRMTFTAPVPPDVMRLIRVLCERDPQSAWQTPPGASIAIERLAPDVG